MESNLNRRTLKHLCAVQNYKHFKDAEDAILGRYWSYEAGFRTGYAAEMVSNNGGEYYTNDMLQRAVRAIEEQRQQILKENEEQWKREIKALECKFQVNVRN